MRRPGLPRRQRLVSYQKDGIGLRHRAAPGPAAGRPPSRAHLHADDQGPKGSHDEAIDDAQGAAAVGAALYERVKAGEPRPLPVRPRPGPEAGMILADTKFEFGTDRGRLCPDRRGADPGLVALLA
jgi:phosphoribosylaminoimidazole-succinocarboxamide synthase